MRPQLGVSLAPRRYVLSSGQFAIWRCFKRTSLSLLTARAIPKSGALAFGECTLSYEEEMTEHVCDILIISTRFRVNYKILLALRCCLTCSLPKWYAFKIWAVLLSSRAHPPMIAVGSDDSNVTYGGKVQIYEYNENTRRVPARLSLPLLACALRRVHVESVCCAWTGPLKRCDCPPSGSTPRQRRWWRSQILCMTLPSLQTSGGPSTCSP